MRTDEVHASSPLFLVGRVGNRAVAIPAAAVERVVRMVALTAIPGSPPDVAGVVNQGTVLAVVDPRPRLGVETPRVRPDQHLVLIAGRSRYLLWIDGIETVTSAGSDALESVAGDSHAVPVARVLRLDGDLLPVLSPDAFDPGPIVTAAVGSSDTTGRQEANPSASRTR